MTTTSDSPPDSLQKPDRQKQDRQKQDRQGNDFDLRDNARTGRWLLGFAVCAVVIVTAVFRLPSCGESFWLDELHSAWVADGPFSQVATRAALGNQTTGYFHLLWIWSAMFGTQESTMRISSVLAACLTAACLVIGVSRRTGRVSAGCVSGMLLAVDPNGVFFGCELRPYACVMWCAVLALWSMMIWLTGPPTTDFIDSPTRIHHRFTIWHSRGGARWRLVMLFWICAGALIHPTSLGVLFGLIPIAWWIAWRIDRLQLWRADWLAVILTLLTLVALAMSSLPNSWAHRDWWKTFGQATSVNQLWYAWAWMPLLWLPAGLALLLTAIARLSLWIKSVGAKPGVHRHDHATQAGQRSVGLSIVPGVVAVFGTVMFFYLSYSGWIPLWHRRYYVAALPLLAWTAGECSAIASNALWRIVDRVVFFPLRSPASAAGHHRMKRWRNRISGFTVMWLLILAALWHHGVLHVLADGRIPLQLRGESWREATERVRAKLRSGDSVWLDSQLIEASFLRDPVSDAGTVSDSQWHYLRFPLDGPYRLENVVVVDCHEHRTWLHRHVGDVSPPARVWLISRSGLAAVNRFVDSIREIRDVSVTKEFSRGPIVVRLDFRQ